MFKMSFQRAARPDKGKLNKKLKARELNWLFSFWRC
jgi:hypothetical protein